MCIDVFDSSPIFKDNFILGVSEQKVLGRILMELYCQSDESGYFRELINREDVRLIVVILIIKEKY